MFSFDILWLLLCFTKLPCRHLHASPRSTTYLLSHKSDPHTSFSLTKLCSLLATILDTSTFTFMHFITKLSLFPRISLPLPLEESKIVLYSLYSRFLYSNKIPPSVINLLVYVQSATQKFTIHLPHFSLFHFFLPFSLPSIFFFPFILCVLSLYFSFPQSRALSPPYPPSISLSPLFLFLYFLFSLSHFFLPSLYLLAFLLHSYVLFSSVSTLFLSAPFPPSR